jgi:hypothetical protein
MKVWGKLRVLFSIVLILFIVQAVYEYRRLHAAVDAKTNEIAALHAKVASNKQLRVCNPAAGCNVCETCCNKYIPDGSLCEKCTETNCIYSSKYNNFLKSAKSVPTLLGQALHAAPTNQLAKLQRPPSKVSLTTSGGYTHLSALFVDSTVRDFWIVSDSRDNNHA